MESKSNSLTEKAWIKPGDMILEKYVFLEQVAEGGIAAILRVQDKNGRELAVKTIKQKIRKTDSPHQLRILNEKLMREGEIHSLFKHPNIIRWVENGTDEVLGTVIVMELAPFGNLRQRITKRIVSMDQIFQIADSLLEGLAIIHQPSDYSPKGFAHLDIEPKNIVFGVGDIPKICDFHFTKEIGNEAYEENFTDQNNPIDIRTDIKQVGKVIYEMITFEDTEKPNLTLVSEPFQSILSKFLAENPAQRPQTTEEAQRLLDELHRSLI